MKKSAGTKARVISATDAEWTAIRERAREKGLTITSYVLELVAKDIGDSFPANRKKRTPGYIYRREDTLKKQAETDSD